MKKIKSLFITLLCVAVVSCSKDSQTDDEPVRDNYDLHPYNSMYSTMLNRYYQNTQAPGAIMLVSRLGQSVWIGSRGVYDMDLEIDMTNTTRFRTGSITKVYVAAYILHLIEQRKLNLNDQLSEILPEVAEMIPGSAEITVKQLLSHMSGIVDPSNESSLYTYDLISDPVTFRKLSIYELLDRYVYGNSLHFAPGTQYQYSNTGYWLLQLIAEKTMNNNLPDLLKTTFFDRLNLKNTYLDSRDDEYVSKGYATVQHNTGLMEVSAYDKADSDGKASGGIVSTAEEISIFMTALFRGKLISPQMLEHMKKSQLPGCETDDCRYGLGLEIWNVNGLTGVGHNGSSVGYETNAVYFDATQTLIVLFKNKGGGSDKSFFYDIAKAYEINDDDPGNTV
jgi:D-alanyl-D-alanine carboxypeptidase